jgi:hypothetical protein
MEDPIRIVIQSVEEETGINYTFLFSKEDAEKIIENEGKEYFDLEEGCFASYMEDKIMIKCRGGGGAAFLSIKDVHRQIEEQLRELDY